ncbi:MAG: DNA recombination protein RmuC [Ilumatobacteraceae bacterium]
MSSAVVVVVAVVAVVALAVGAFVAMAAARRFGAGPADVAAEIRAAQAAAAAAAATQAAVAEAQSAAAAAHAIALADAQAATAASQADALSRAFQTAIATLQAKAGHERDVAVQAALSQVAVMGKQQLGAQTAAAVADLAAKKDIIESRLGQIQTEVRTDLDRLATLVGQLGESTSQRFGQVDSSLRAHAEITQHLTSTTQGLREALASPNNRGQWGERMAEDILRSAGFIEHKQYRKRTAVEGDGQGIPDFTFIMPKGQVLFMDVKFPMAAYLRYLDATTDAERGTHRATFLRDVRMRVKELAKREYACVDSRAAVDNVLLFVPNETLSAFIHENDPALIDEAMRQNVVICSPLTLFAFLGIIRQAFDNYVMEQTSQEMMQLLGKFAQQWHKYSDAVDRVKKNFDTVHRSFEELATTRKRALDRPLKDLEALRLERGVAVDGELFAVEVLQMEGYRELGA